MKILFYICIHCIVLSEVYFQTSKITSYSGFPAEKNWTSFLCQLCEKPGLVIYINTIRVYKCVHIIHAVKTAGQHGRVLVQSETLS